MNRARLATVAAVVAGLTFSLLPPAAAADTATTFEVTAGVLAISVPASVNLGSAKAPGTISAALGQVKAEDGRGLLTTSYKASVASTDFVTGVSPNTSTLAASALAYTGGVVTATGTVTCASLLVAAPLATTSQVAMDATLASGTNSCAWNPTIAVTLPTTAVAGTYTGTITHSVA